VTRAAINPGPTMLAALIVLLPSISLAQAGNLFLFADPQGVDCRLPDAPGISHYYIVHTNTSGATSVSFAAPLPPCHTGDWLSDDQPFSSTLGDSQHGVTVLYGTCLYSPIHVLTINVQTYGTTTPCCCYPIAAYSGSGNVEMTDCDGRTWPIFNGWGSFVNATVGSVALTPIVDAKQRCPWSRERGAK
jgi:hypothetical protein